MKRKLKRFTFTWVKAKGVLIRWTLFTTTNTFFTTSMTKFISKWTWRYPKSFILFSIVLIVGFRKNSLLITAWPHTNLIPETQIDPNPTIYLKLFNRLLPSIKPSNKSKICRKYNWKKQITMTSWRNLRFSDNFIWQQLFTYSLIFDKNINLPKFSFECSSP